MRRQLNRRMQENLWLGNRLRLQNPFSRKTIDVYKTVKMLYNVNEEVIDYEKRI